MGVSYMLRCVKCYKQIEVLDDEYYENIDDYDKLWEELYEKLDPDCGFHWGIMSVKRLIKWLNIHKEHGDIEFTAE